jgi:small subunit ribosomal protein S14
MAKTSSIEKNDRRRRMVKKYAGKWARLKAIANDESRPMDERFAARLKMAAMPRVRNRCTLTGRPRGNYRKFGMSRLMLRELASQGKIPGVTKSSW